MPYYSEAEPEIYHICQNCYVGQKIEARNLRQGQPVGAKLCAVCANLNQARKCDPGTPPPPTE